MKIENYSDQYLLDVSNLIQNFHTEAIGEYEGIASPYSIVQTIRTAQHENAFLLLLEGKCEGILYGTVFDSLTSGEHIFQEVIWYVNKPFRRYGIQMMSHVRNVLKSRGVNIMIMAVLENSK